MRPRINPRLAWLALALVLTFPACAAGRAAPVEWRPGGTTVGVYRARLVDGERPDQRFRLMLYAELPDRLHGEIVSPVGSSVLIVDGGAGRLAVSLVREGVSFVGSASERDLESVFGLRVSLRQLVEALLTGELSAEGYAVLREARQPVGLPDVFEIRQGERALTLRLKRLKPGPGSRAGLGTGEPPRGMERRPLEELERDLIRGAVEDPDRS